MNDPARVAGYREAGSLMARRLRRKSISLPITLGSLTVVLAGALLVGWSVLLGQRIAASEDIGV